MHASRGRVVIASALPEEAERLRGMLNDAGFSETVCVSDGLSAVRRTQEKMTDVIVADAVLPVLDGSGLSKRICELPLTVYPAVILLAAKGMCPKTSVCVLEKPVHTERILEAIDSLQPHIREVPAEKYALAQHLFDQIGIPEHCGREYLLYAIGMVWLDARLIKSLSARIYPAVANRFGTNEKHVARAMRHVIDMAWRGGAMEAQYQVFGDTIDAKRGSPTLSEMIARIADILRWEGRA